MVKVTKILLLAVVLALMASLVGWGVAERPAETSAQPPPLTIVTTSLPDGAIGVPYSQTLQASGGTGVYTWARVWGMLPAGLSLNSATGVISGTPTMAATFSFVVQVKDGVSSVTKGLSIKINPRLTTLTITTTSLPNGNVGAAYSQTLSASGGTGSYTWSITVGSPPPGLGIDGPTGVISGMPTTPGTYPFTVQVADGASTATMPLSITINPQLTITTVSLPNGYATVPYSQALSASGGSGVYNWSLASGVLPPGLGINGTTGVISGTPTTVGTYPFTAQVADGIGTATQPLSITISAVLLVTTTSLPDGHTGVAYLQTLSASGGTGVYTWSITVGSLPPGLGPLTPTGVISGTPNTAGTFNFTVQVADGVTTATKPLSITIDPPLIITTASLPDGNTSAPYSQTVQATGGTGVYTWSISAGALPPGLGIDGATGVIAGTPTAPGTFNFTVRVADGLTTATKALSITIGGALTITTASLPGGQVGLAYSQALQASGGTGSYTWSRVWGMLPAGLSLNSATGVISGIPTMVASFSFIVRVQDGVSSVTKGLSIRIYPQLVIATTSLPDGDLGMAYSRTLQASGGTGSYTWSLAAGTLPPGLGISASGIISGIPTAEGTYNFTVQVADGIDATTKALSIKINPQLVITTTSLSDGNVGTPYSQTLQASGGSGSYTWSVVVGTLPPGLSLNSFSGVISGPPTLAGTFLFTVRVNDGIGTVTKALSIEINPQLVITTPSPLPVGTPGTFYSQALAATGGAGPGSYTWSIPGVVTLPPGLSLSAAGVISGTPDTPGPYNFTVQVADGIGIATKTFSITIGNWVTVTINQAVGQPDPTYTGTINFTVVFSETVDDFEDGDVTLGGTAGATTAVVTGTGTTYNVAVSGMTSSGTVIAMIPAGVATGASGPNTPSTSTDNTVYYDDGW